jgi:N-formylglutamate amidohydrolase
MKEILSIHKPKNPLPLVFDSPHSGSHYPDDFHYACDLADLRRTEDSYVDELFACVPAYGGALLAAHFPRSYIDVNRAHDDIDPELLAGAWAHGTIAPTARSEAGIGLIRRLVRPGVPIYDRSLSAAEIAARIERYYHPYHGALDDLLRAAHYNFGQAWHINCHSMPSSGAYPKRAAALVGNAPRHSDFCLGDRDGTTCDLEFTHALRDFLKQRGYTVTLNDPYKGVELVRRYSSPARGIHSLQLEINRALYMSEETLEKSDHFPALQSDIEKLVAFCASFAESRLTDMAAD